MTKKRIFILDGHPAETSLSRTFAETYAEAARATGHEVKIAHLNELDFDPDFGDGGYSNPKPLEPSIEEVLKNLEWSDHFVLASPLWWGGLPAMLKGLFDRVLLPGRTFDTHVKPGKLPKPMLTGRTARVILTSDTPGWVMRILYKNALLNQLRNQILGFIGIKPTKVSYFSGATHPEPGKIKNWIKNIEKIGASAA